VELAGGLRGWMPTALLRACNQLPTASEQRRAQMMQDAPAMIGTPYLWGGNSAHGIDCSGFAQLLHHWVGVTLPRDADMQCNASLQVEPPFRPGDLLFFGDKGEQANATHVGVSIGGWKIIHSSRARNGVYLDDVQSVEHLQEGFLKAGTFLEN